MVGRILVWLPMILTLLGRKRAVSYTFTAATHRQTNNNLFLERARSVSTTTVATITAARRGSSELKHHQQKHHQYHHPSWASVRTRINSMSLSPSSSLSSTPANSYGIDMDQNTLMETDMLVAVDEKDQLIPQVVLSKKEGHTFTAETPRATLHRAFSFFLFNAENKLLLTQRAASKITFPSVWTNTVCSHPLYDMTPNEVDVVPEAYPDFPGIKHAAIRKCKHEMNIDAEYLPHSQIQFITRFHYWAADSITYGKDSPWGEHEVDYILFLKTDQSVPISNANSDEVADYKYVSRDELRDMLKDPTLLWSPWFLGIMERGGWDWWADVEGALAGRYTNDSITFFDPPSEHVASYNLPSHTQQTGVLQ